MNNNSNIIQEICDKLYTKYSRTNIYDPSKLQKAVDSYTSDLAFVLEAHGPEILTKVHQKMGFDSRFYEFKDLSYLMPTVITALLIDDCARYLYFTMIDEPKEQPKFNLIDKMIYKLGMMSISLFAIIAYILWLYPKSMTKIISVINIKSQTIEESVLRPSIEECENQLKGLKNNVSSNLKTYTLLSLHHSLATTYSILLAQTTNKEKANQYANKIFECQKQCTQAVEELSTSKLSLGDVCCWNMSIAKQYLHNINEDVKDILQQRAILREYRQQGKPIMQKFINIMCEVLKKHQIKVTDPKEEEELEEAEKIEYYLKTIITAINGEVIAKDLEEILQDPIDLSIIFHPITTMRGGTYNHNTIMNHMSVCDSQNKPFTDPRSNVEVERKFIENMWLTNFIDFLTLGGEVKEYPGFVSPLTGAAYVKPIITFSGNSIELSSNTLPKNFVLMELSEKFSPVAKFKPA